LPPHRRERKCVCRGMWARRTLMHHGSPPPTSPRRRWSPRCRLLLPDVYTEGGAALRAKTFFSGKPKSAGAGAGIRTFFNAPPPFPQRGQTCLFDRHWSAPQHTPTPQGEAGKRQTMAFALSAKFALAGNTVKVCHRIIV